MRILGLQINDLATLLKSPENPLCFFVLYLHAYTFLLLYFHTEHTYVHTYLRFILHTSEKVLVLIFLVQYVGIQ
jgi:hypothetical protein